MRLRIVLPKVNPEAITVPTRCSYAGCAGKKFGCVAKKSLGNTWTGSNAARSA